MKSTASILLLLLLVASSVASLLPQDVEEEWEEWKEEHVKVYGSRQEEDTARAAWRRNRDYVIAHNNRADVTFTVALNQFADQDQSARTPLVFQSRSQPLRFTPEVGNNFLPRAPPASFDWRPKGVVPPVHNQGQMGSPEAYAVTDALESLHAIKTGQLVDLSTSEVVDCCSTMGPGQLGEHIYECIHGIGGLCSEASYPSTAGTCRNNSCSAAADDATKTVFVKKGDENEMVLAVLKCPLVVYIDASHASFQMYKAGIYEDSDCSKTMLDHAVLLVGYGQVSDGTLYWILKNSWGSSWGMQGYMLMKRGVNMCGIADYAHYPQ